MTTEVKHSGAWRTLTGVEVKHSGSWRTVQTIEVKHGGTWRTVYSGLACSLSTASVTHSTSIGTCYAVVQYNTTGIEYQNGSPTSSVAGTSRGNWLDSGSASSCYGSLQVTGGSLYYNDFPAYPTRAAITANKKAYVRDANSGPGAALANITVYMHDAASGGNLLSSASFSLSASYSSGCPLCCFTPDTPILMASGLEVPIGRIRLGDEIMVMDEGGNLGKEKVTEVITRQNRTMHVVQFEDGSILKASDDHPIYVEEKGYCSINPTVAYKDLGIPNKLLIGDLASRPDGSRVAITYIGPLDYPGTVFTLGNSRFFANGKLVY